MEEDINVKAKKIIKKRWLWAIFGFVALNGFSVFAIVSKSIHKFIDFSDNNNGTETRTCTKCNYSETRNKRLFLNAFDDIVYPFIDCVKDYLNA